MCFAESSRSAVLKRACFLLTVILLPTSLLAQAADIRVAVAANFARPMKVLAEQFSEDSAYTLTVSLGSSGKLYAQIVHGAPFDLFFSADQEKPLALEQRGLAQSGTRFTYALGALLLWSGSKPAGTSVKELLLTGEFQRLALANPRFAPYGTAADDVLQNLGLLEQTRSKRVLGENIAQTFQFVASGNADLGFVALSQLTPLESVAAQSIWRVPATLHRTIRQDAVLLAHAADSDAAREFLTFVRSERAARIMEAHGYRAPSHSGIQQQ